MTRSKKILLTVAAVFVVMQFFPAARNSSSGALPTDITKQVAVPRNVQDILKVSCYDCHSNNTAYPWYSHVQPVGWWLANHIKEGKAQLNFNEFGTYSQRRQANKLKEVAATIKEGSMPLSSYTIIHKNAILSNEEKVLLIDWATKTRDSLKAKNQ